MPQGYHAVIVFVQFAVRGSIGPEKAGPLETSMNSERRATQSTFRQHFNPYLYNSFDPLKFIKSRAKFSYPVSESNSPQQPRPTIQRQYARAVQSLPRTITPRRIRLPTSQKCEANALRYSHRA